MARFATVGQDQYNTILKEMNSPNAHRGTTVAWNVFLSYLKEKGITTDPQNISNCTFNL